MAPISRVEAQATGNESTTPKGKQSYIEPSLPRAKQSRSSLMRLPSELRLMILRELLVNEQPLLDRTLYEAKKSTEAAKDTEDTCDLPATEGDGLFFPKTQFVSGYELNPAILRACQQLYAEGRPVLYAENIIGLRVCSSAWTKFIINRGDIKTLKPWTISLPAYDMGQYTDNMTLLHEREIEFVSCFKSLHIALYIAHDRTLTRFPRLAIRCLAPAMTDSTVGIHVHEMHAGDDASILCFLKVFNLARCKALSFIGVSETTTSQTKHVVDTATGSSPVVDLGVQLDQIWDHSSLRYFMCAGYDSAFVAWARQKLCALETAAVDCNSEAFCKIISEIIPKLDQEFEAIRQRLEISKVLELEYNPEWKEYIPLLEHRYKVQHAAVQEKYAAASGFLKKQLVTRSECNYATSAPLRELGPKIEDSLITDVPAGFTYLTSACTARAYRGRDIKQTVPALVFMIEAVRRKINPVVTAFGLAPKRLST
ncbi:hypothetical protein LTR70_000263 [Exophiala xenobiotica]|nr:hypothetical protein LTR70_000263 [Exophiala xenobiotica]